MDDIKLFDDDTVADEEFDEEFDEEYDEDFDDDEEDVPPARKRTAKPCRKKKKSALVPIIIILAILLALGSAYYFFLGDFISQFLMNRNIETLADVAAYDDVTAYAESVVGARLKYDALSDEVKAKVDETGLIAAEAASDAMRNARDTLAALPAADISVADYPASRTMIQQSRAAFDLLTDAQKVLVGESALTNAEALLSGCYAANTAVIDLNDEIAAFTLTPDIVRSTLDEETLALADLITRGAALDQSLVNNASLSEKKSQLDSKLNQFSDITLNETSELSGYNYTLGGLIDGISEAVTSAEKSHGKYAYDTDAISAAADQISATIASMQELTGPSSVGIISLEHDYGADMNMQLTLLSGHIADAVNYIKNTEVEDDDQVAALTGYVDNAKSALAAYGTASQSYFAEIAGVVQGYIPFTESAVGTPVQFLPVTGAVAAQPAGEEPAEPGAQEQPAEEQPAEEGEAGYVNDDDVNFRDAPSTDGNSLGKQAKNTALRILGEEDGWYKVKIGDKTGYIRKDYVDKGNPSD